VARTRVKQRLDCNVVSITLDAAQQRKRCAPNATTVVELAHMKEKTKRRPLVEWEKHTGKGFRKYYGCWWTYASLFHTEILQ
jgi:hypothetical protein